MIHPLTAAGSTTRPHWHRLCKHAPTSLPFEPRHIEILAEAYELGIDNVEFDLALLQLYPWSGLDHLAWLRRRYHWDVSVCVYYLAALRRILMGMPPAVVAA
jgi:hypothetical protein